MADIDYKSLNKRIRDLMDKHRMTQSQLAEIAEMHQSAVSKALSDDDSNTFTLPQLFRIAQHFKISIDYLVGNKFTDNSSISPPEVFNFLVKLLCSGKLRTTKIKVSEIYYKWYPLGENWGETARTPLDVEYTAFYFQDYYQLDDFAFNDCDQDFLDTEFGSRGNTSPFYLMNIIINNLLPIIQVYRKGDISEEFFNPIKESYLERLIEELSEPNDYRIFEDRFLP